MAKNRKHAKSSAGNSAAKVPPGTTLAAHPPARHPTLLAVSVALFVLWFIFLLVTALAA
jgi:hypothetical protein